MQTKIRHLFSSSHFAFLLLLIVTWVAFGLINPSILTLANVFSLTRASIIPALFSLALLLIIVLGSFDFSFAMIGAFSSYCSIYIFTQAGMMDVSLIIITLVAVVIAVVLETVNWFFIDKLRLQPFITTLGMQSLLKGAILAFISSSFIYTLPNSLQRLSTNYITRARFPDGTESVLHVGVVVVVVLYMLAHVMLQYTTFGRKVYAIGADSEAAQRAGINVSRVRFIIFVLSGAVCGIAGVLHDALARSTVPIPMDLVGQELTFIAAVMLGYGTSKKASGAVFSTLIAVLFLRFVSTNLIMLGIPSYWQKVVTGGILLVGLLVQISNKRKLVAGKE